jgi:hypothetical protein
MANFFVDFDMRFGELTRSKSSRTRTSRRLEFRSFPKALGAPKH